MTVLSWYQPSSSVNDIHQTGKVWCGEGGRQEALRKVHSEWNSFSFRMRSEKNLIFTIFQNEVFGYISNRFVGIQYHLLSGIATNPPVGSRASCLFINLHINFQAGMSRTIEWNSDSCVPSLRMSTCISSNPSLSCDIATFQIPASPLIETCKLCIIVQSEALGMNGKVFGSRWLMSNAYKQQDWC